MYFLPEVISELWISRRFSCCLQSARLSRLIESRCSSDNPQEKLEIRLKQHENVSAHDQVVELSRSSKSKLKSPAKHTLCCSPMTLRVLEHCTRHCHELELPRWSIVLLEGQRSYSFLLASDREDTSSRVPFNAAMRLPNLSSLHGRCNTCRKDWSRMHHARRLQVFYLTLLAVLAISSQQNLAAT